MKKSAILLMLATASAGASHAQDLLAGKPVYTLGEPMTWSAGENSITFKTEDLAKLTAQPTNTENVYLYPENGTINTEENRAKGAQVFYVDMEAVYQVGTVTTTWEGAAADAFDIYLTSTVPTTAILNETPTYQDSGLGQYTKNVAIMPEGSEGRYLVFRVTNATNWGWGVKIRSIAAEAPTETVLTTFTVSPLFTNLNAETPLTLNYLDQNGLAISADEVTLSVSDNATLSNNILTVNSGSVATLSAKFNDRTLTANVYVPSAPAAPASAKIKTPIFTNTLTDNNATVQFVTGYNGGAQDIGEFTFTNGETARAFANTRCVFFSNKETTGEWNADINPTELGYRSLHLDIFGTKNANGTVTFENTTTIGNNHPFTLKAGEWTSVEVVLTGETNLHTMSVRFDEANMSDILLTNIYFTAAFADDDENAPVISDITATPTRTGAILTLTATDDKNEHILYEISDGVNNYSVEGLSGQATTYTLRGLKAETNYNLTITASDGKNICEAKNVVLTTLAYPNFETPEPEAKDVAAIFAPAYEKSEYPTFITADGSKAEAYEGTTEDGSPILILTNYAGQNGYIGGEANIGDCTILHLDIFGDTEDGKLTISPSWQAAENTPSKEVTVKANVWNAIEIPLTELGKEMQNNNVVYRLNLNNSTLSDLALANYYFYNDQPGTDSIEEIEVKTAAKDVCFDLQGRRVMNPVRGIFIINGKKVIR